MGLNDPSASTHFSLGEPQLSAWRKDFYDSPKNRLALNVCTARDPINACRRSAAELSTVLFGHKTWQEARVEGKATSGGPGWICTGLDLLRAEFAKQFPLPPGFEFSASHLFFWHKLERCNYFLSAVSQLLERCEPLDGRHFRFLMAHAAPDAGNWQMFVNLVKKHGVMPKSCYLATRPRSALQLNKILKSKLHEYASILHSQFTFDGDASRLPKIIGRMMPRLHKVISICLGDPPQQFTWTFYNQKKQYQSQTFPNGQSFFDRVVAKFVNLDEFVCLGHDPRQTSSYQSNFMVEHSSNMVDGLPQKYNNQPIETLMNIMVESLSDNTAVWLACDLCSRFTAKLETLSLTQKTHNFGVLFGMDVGSTLNKAERMLYKESRRNAALLITAVGLGSANEPVEFRTISAAVVGKTASTGSLHDADEDKDEKNEKKDTKDDMGKRAAAKTKAATVDADWLREYAFEIVVQKIYVPFKVLNNITTSKGSKLPPWDPMGALLG
ncbi:hypothetical protein KR018_002309 [Drosophila ironensis]|nr:hypothetical protein KR018_002309 [Drosophila ironensis]